MTDTTPIFDFLRTLTRPYPRVHFIGEDQYDYAELLSDQYDKFQSCFFQKVVETGLVGCRYIYERILYHQMEMQDFVDYPEPDDDEDLIGRFRFSADTASLAIDFIEHLLDTSFPGIIASWNDVADEGGTETAGQPPHYERITLDEQHVRTLFKNLTKKNFIVDVCEDDFVYYMKGVGGFPSEKMLWKNRATLLIQLLEEISSKSIEFKKTEQIWSNNFKAGNLRSSYQQITDTAREKNDVKLEPILRGVK